MPVLNRVMFRQQGSPMTGEMYDFDIQMKQKPELDSYGQRVIDPEFQNFLLDVYGDRGQGILDILLQGNTPDNFSMLSGLINEFTNYKLVKEKEGMVIPEGKFELDPTEQRYLESLKYRQEGSPMEGEESDAVGIAEGLDEETPPSNPTSDGIAKVSPEQYVQLMNEIRGDDVPLEGRVNELAMTVGEQDAQDTPLSVLALVQPVFELQEQQGIGATQQAQEMVPTAANQLNQPMSDGIVRANTGLFINPTEAVSFPGQNMSMNLNIPTQSAPVSPPQNYDILQGMMSPSQYDFVTTMGENLFGMGQDPIDVTKRAQEYEKRLLDNADLKGKFMTTVVSPLLAQTAMDILDPNKSFSEVLVSGLSRIGVAGQAGEKLKQPYATQAMNLAAKDKEIQDAKQSDFIKLFGAEAIKKAFADTNREIVFQSVDGVPMAFYKDNGLPVYNQDLYFNTLANQRIQQINDTTKLNVANEVKNLFPDLTEQELIQIGQDVDYFVKNSPRFKKDFLETQEGKEFVQKGEDNLRNQYLVNTKDFASAVRQFSILDTIAQDGTGATDMALVYTYMKILDPASVVRESEYGVAAETDLSKIDAVTTNLINKILNGSTVLTKPQRASLIAAARGALTGQYQAYKSFTDQFANIAERRGLDVNNVIIDYTLGLNVPKVDEFSSTYDFTQHLDGLINAPFLGSEFADPNTLNQLKNQANQ